MMLVTIEVCGDHWINKQSVLNTLATAAPDETIVLDFCNEGPCFALLELEQHLHNRTVQIQRFPNTVETVPYTRITVPKHSHFWEMSKQYNTVPVPKWNQEYLFGLFIGRRTRARCSIVYDVAHEFEQESLISLMRDTNPLPWQHTVGEDFEQHTEWPVEAIHPWWNTVSIPSVDDHAKNDQFDPAQNTNRDLLKHYHRFAIELVCETYTLGDSFFVTEKTVRPISAGKPLFAYAPKHFLARLRELGFKTWVLLWDETYDNYEGIQRWMRIKQQMCQLAQLNPAEFAELEQRAQAICVYNKQVQAEMLGKENDKTHF